ncbi:multicopper oxidase domain-containing protein [Pontibacter sp. G13]|uniref:multicopper oxidase domain-containing protein n=1 Tax=Pontibacter sp. G13 TaxID=3074898 RepID=UPI002889B18A|nr:multicopper oxidase domain-containing protein [Pontibacter sp. G13]WNJ20955.1 multicopper oxidase domain-containing protein [Pontibacter sp. G13]
MNLVTRPFACLCWMLVGILPTIAQPTFQNKAPIPKIYDASEDTVKLVMQQFFSHQFNPANPTDTLNGLETWAYNVQGDTSATIFGPTIKWHTGESTLLQVINQLPQPTTTHWHGAEVPAQFDGGPHQPIHPDSTWYVNFTNLDSSSTMWYHPHYHNNTYPQVQMGLSGMIISEQATDPIRDVLPQTYGKDDIPVILSDLRVIWDSTLNPPRRKIDTLKSKRPINVVNGVTDPYFEVPAHYVRLRILNGSTRKGTMFGISDSYTGDSSSLKPFILVATDGGYTIQPDTLTMLLIGPGARAELLLDLRDYAVGDSLYLRNMNQYMPGFIVGSPFLSPLGGGGDSTAGEAFMQMKIIADPQDYTPVDTFPGFTSMWDPSLQDTIGLDTQRLKTFVFWGKGKGFTIDSTTFNMMRIDDTVCVGNKEIWTIHNPTAIAHPFHIHKIFFRILDIQDSTGTLLDLNARGLNGPKDDILVQPGWRVRFLAKFDDYPNPIQANLSYMYHCHILTHEDSLGGGMMKQFVVTNEGPCARSNSIYDRLAQDWKLYPNPASETLFLQADMEYPSEVTIIDLQGRVVRQEKLGPIEGLAPIDVSHLKTGFYLVRWSNPLGWDTRKVLIQER